MSRDKETTLADVRTAVGGVALGVADYLANQLPLLHHPSWWEQGTVGLYVLGGSVVAGAIGHNRWWFSRYQTFLRKLADEHGGTDGWLNMHDLQDYAGTRAIRRDPAHARPSLEGSRGQAPSEFGFQVGRLVSGGRRMRGKRVWSPHTQSFVAEGPQGSGKTQLVVHPILDSPGALVVASTKPELAVLTARLRSEVGPVFIFNPLLLGSVGNSFMWDPVSGCRDQAVADQRAWALVRGGGGAAGIDRADFWAGKAQEIIRCYLMAAALKGWDMGAVMHWSNDPDDPTPVAVLEQHSQFVPAGWVETLRSRLGASHNTRTGYFATVTSCVSFMDNPTVAAACRPPAEKQFDVEEFLANKGTLYLIGGAEDKRLAPLLTAFTEYVFTAAKKTAAQMPHQKLDPTLNIILDEVANITPVPLDAWASDSRGWGITVGAVVQSKSQFTTTWGRDRAEVIWENLVTKIILPKVSNRQHLEELAFLAGERTVKVVTTGDHSDQTGRRSASTSTTYRKEPVVSGQTISSMPKWHAYVLGLGQHAAVVKFEPGYKRTHREERQLTRSKDQRKLRAVTAFEAAAERSQA